ncbi:RsmB/NOP family class I SAM-dependent RNA methyltransferase [Zhihengliuella flava]|uniref:16S rRNA (Cytosine967-C5)-methyltransferase n=1 Tax=Zhihengliuella flava TaxID=1285193 RepID=A0A931DAZ3_9MICC|nr:transcription antitermination factor NusB [Zhihengliuella flava]MBG6085717.1 16S rRNA (cytosine967-C5)-methyltransferase [Zhihengliuella flava]
MTPQQPQPRGSRRNDKGRQRNRGGTRHYSESAPAARKRTADPARRVAFEVLRAVAEDDAYANLVLPTRLRRARLGARDAAFATELAYGALRGQGTYDAVLSRCVDRPLSRLDAAVLDALRLGAHQLLAMRVPHHAALDETVALTRAEIGAGASGLVNAVLRKVAAHSLSEWVATLTADLQDETAAAAIEHSHPEWVVRALRQSLAAHGRDVAEIGSLLAADNAAPRVNLVALPGLGDLAALCAAGAEVSSLAPDAATYDGGDPGRLPGLAEGRVRVQDAGSQLVARALAGAPLAGPDERWLDLCAGPGGKAALLAALASQRGAHLEANEVAEHRARLVSQALAGVDPHAFSVVTGDGRRYAGSAGGYDRIMLDAPCSGLGALRRRPESRWRKSPGDIAELTQLQSELFDAAVAALRPGGVLAYVTCSPHPAETTAVVLDALARHPRLRALDAEAALDAVALTPTNAGAQVPDKRGAPLEGARTAQLWPHQHGTDAMFMALLTLEAE